MTVEAHIHPKSGAAIAGVRLGKSAVTKPTDMYDCSDGTWRALGACLSGTALETDRTGAIIVRPNVELSGSARTLLSRLLNRGFYLTRYAVATPGWRLIPLISAKTDRRMDWKVDREEDAEELVRYGLVAPTEEDPEVYAVTDNGLAAAGRK